MKKQLFTLIWLLAVSLPVFAQNAFPVRFAHGTEFFPENFAAEKQRSVGSAEVFNGVFARYIQFSKVMNASERAALEATGVKVVGYVQLATYLTLIPQNFDFQRIEAFSPRSIMAVNPDWKLARSLRKKPFGAWATHGDYVDLNLQVYPSISIEEGANLCRQYDVDVVKIGNQNGLIQISIPQDRLEAVAALPFVQYLELIPPPSEKDDTKGRSLHRTNLIDSDAPMGKKYNGEGVNTLVRDDGTVGPHIDFKGRLDNLNALNGSNTHGDYVSGCVGGAGNLNPAAKGMASGAFIYVMDYQADFQDETMSLVANKDITITNTSYTDGFNAGYTINAQTVDQQLFSNPNLTHVFSAGNANDDNMDFGYGAGTQWGNITGGHKMAKNAFLAANIAANGAINVASSRGPATDGRLKPDIAAFGEDVNMTQPNNTYSLNTGTSFSAPNIAGCMAQLTQAFRTINNVTDVPSALLKATMLNTANDLGNVGPDFIFGWGHVNSWRALQLLEQNNWAQGSTDQNGDATHTLQIPAGVKEAKIMIYWPEPPALENSAKTLINDLDLSVNDAAGTSYLPWILDPSPVPAKLNAPATRGRDSLNNVEQVLIENPAAGTYTVHIKGTEVPLGPQSYFLVWEFVKDEIKVTYPAGGEGFAPGEVERIHWDAYGNTGSFTLRYSTDGGNSFNALGSVAGDKRMYDWTVPNTVSGKVHVLVIRGAKRDTSDFASSIVPVPQNVQVAKVCPDSMWINWTEINDTLSYDVYLLGAKYMELKGTSNTNLIGLPINNPALEQWVAVRTSHADGTAGRRSVAVRWPGQLLNCNQENDLSVSSFPVPGGGQLISCSPTTYPVSIRVQNQGQNTATGGFAYYQVNNGPIVSEALPDIPLAGVLDYTFQTPLSVSTNDPVSLKAWSFLPNDITNFNDTLKITFPVAAQSTNQFFIENFEAQTSFPNGWLSINPDNLQGWRSTVNLSVPIVGSDDVEGNAVYIDFFNYGTNLEGREDYLYMKPLDLAGMDHPSLTFDLAHARFDNTFSDSLRVELYTNCDLNSTPVKIWGKADPALATTTPRTSFYNAGAGSDWRNETVDLTDYAGQKVIIRFVTVNGYGNTLFLDNIGIKPFEVPLPPVAEFAAPDSTCRLDTIVFQATPTAINTVYSWSFGSAGIPSSAMGIGPHNVYYPTAGNKTVRLITTNPVAADTQTQVITVRPLATANFTAAYNGLTATFTNTSQNGDSYLWDFGDGTTSTETNPVHTYALPGAYVVTLSATNVCRTHVKTLNVGVTGVQELSEQMDIRILPNPTAGDFAVELNSRQSGGVEFNLFDASGKNVVRKEMSLKSGANRVNFENLNLPKGIYQLQIQSNGKQASFHLVVQ